MSERCSLCLSLVVLHEGSSFCSLRWAPLTGTIAILQEEVVGWFFRLGLHVSLLGVVVFVSRHRLAVSDRVP